MRLLIDTNVWLDNYIPERANFDLVGRLFTEALRQEHDLLYAVQTAKDVFFLINHAYKQQARANGGCSEDDALAINEIAWACVANMGELATAVGADASDIWIAQKYKRLHHDFEDDLVIAAALRAKADYLVTLDEKLVKKAPVAALTPADMLELLALRATPTP